MFQLKGPNGRFAEKEAKKLVELKKSFEQQFQKSFERKKKK